MMPPSEALQLTRLRQTRGESARRGKNQMHQIFTAATILLILLIPRSSPACQTDRDCSAGSRCVKRFGQLQGACARGAPINDGSERLPRNPAHPVGSDGEPCQFESDCAAGLRCVAQSSSAASVCSR